MHLCAFACGRRLLPDCFNCCAISVRFDSKASRSSSQRRRGNFALGEHRPMLPYVCMLRIAGIVLFMRSPSGAGSRAGSAKKPVRRRRRGDRRWAKALRADLPGVPRRKCGRRRSGSRAVDRRFSAWQFGQRSVPEHSLRDSRHADVGVPRALLRSGVATGELSPQPERQHCRGESNRRWRCSRRRESLLRQSRLRGRVTPSTAAAPMWVRTYPTPEESRPRRCAERSSSRAQTLTPAARGGPSTLIVRTKDGQEMRGIRRSEDSFSVLMMDASGKLVRLDKRESFRPAHRCNFADAGRLCAAPLGSRDPESSRLLESPERPRPQPRRFKPTSPAASPLSGFATLQAEPQNWLTYWGDYQGRHFSGLKEIGASNVARACRRDGPCRCPAIRSWKPRRWWWTA